MAPFLRASLHGLRSSRCLQRERCLLKLPESNCLKQRWYAESAVLEDSTPTVNDAASENGAASKVSHPLETVDAMRKQVAAKEIGQGAVNQELASPESSTDKLTSLIIGKMRSKNSSSGPRDATTADSQSGSAFSKASKPLEESKEPGKVDKWDQVVVSMRNLAVKKREEAGNTRANASVKPALPKSEDRMNEEDFADLDLPSGPLSKALSNSEKLPSTDEAFNSFLSNSKQRDGSKQKAKAVSFSFLKALDSDPMPHKAPSSEVESHFGSSPRPKVNGLQHTRKESRPSSWDYFASSDTNSSPLPKVNRESLDNSKRSGGNLMQMNSSKSKYMVCVQNLSSHNDFALIKEALSSHGEVISSYKQPNSNGSFSAFIEFQTVEAMDDALAARWVRIDNKAYGIVRVIEPCTTVVRLSKVGASTTDSQVQMMCEKFGNVDNIRKRRTGFYDVFFKAGDLPNMPTILDRLNEVTLNQNRWIAQPAPLLHPLVKREVLKSSEGQAWHAQQLSQLLTRIQTGLNTVSLSFEDLKSLIAMEDEMSK